MTIVQESSQEQYGRGRRANILKNEDMKIEDTNVRT